MKATVHEVLTALTRAGQNLETDSKTRALIQKMEEESRSQARQEYKERMARVNGKANHMNDLLQAYARRAGDIARSADDFLDNVKDLRLNRMRRQVRPDGAETAEAAKQYAALGFDQTLRAMEEALRQVGEEVARLEAGLVPKEMAGAVGKVVPPFRKKNYLCLIRLRENIRQGEKRIRALCEEKRRSLSLSNQRARHAVEGKLDRELAYATRVAEDSRRLVTEKCRQGMARLRGEGLCGGQDGILLGTACLPPRAAALGLPIRFPVSAAKLVSNLIFVKKGKESLAGAFSALALDLLARPRVRVTILDVEGTGYLYSDLLPFAPHLDKLQILRTREDADRFARETLAEMAGSGPTGAEHYLFVDNLTDNLPDHDAERWISIVKNGRSCGVYVIAAVGGSCQLERREQQGLVQAFFQNCRVLRAEGEEICIHPMVNLELPAFQADKARALVSKLAAEQEAARILPLPRYLPARWGQADSTQGLHIPVGLDPEGNAVFLDFTERKPYALGIGDVDSGKTSLAHTMVLGALARYAPSQLVVALADFKHGSEFNRYGLGGCPGVLAVIDDEDPDVMASFLRRYVAELARRQQAFSRLESASGKALRKYEEYRQVQTESGVLSPELPRILILIDEYQSIFEGTAETAALLSELVRKGRTYGIHIAMFSQRALSDSARNSFTPGLKDYFTTRILLKSPQSAARHLFADRASDTGRENTAVPQAALLEPGHAIFNAEGGQTQRANRQVQVFYPTGDDISRVLGRLRAERGVGHPALLRAGADSLPAPSPLPDRLRLGSSPCLEVDRAVPGMEDVFLDDREVSLRLEGCRRLLCLGPDSRAAVSVCASAMACATLVGVEIHVFGGEADPVIAGLRKLGFSQANFHLTAGEITAELARQLQQGGARCLDLFVNLGKNEAFIQSLGSLHSKPGADMLRKALEGGAGWFQVLVERKARTLRNNLPYAMSEFGCRVVSVGEQQDTQQIALPEGLRTQGNPFEIPRSNAYHAYYYNADTGKFGKVILYKYRKGV